MGGRGKVLDQEEAFVVSRGGLGKIFSVLEQCDLEWLRSNLDDDVGRPTVVGSGAVEWPEARLQDRCLLGDTGDVFGGLRSREKRLEDQIVNFGP